MMCTAPKSEYLLDKTGAFPAEQARKELFGAAFLDAMLEQAKLDKTFNQIEGAQRLNPRECKRASRHDRPVERKGAEAPVVEAGVVSDGETAAPQGTKTLVYGFYLLFLIM